MGVCALPVLATVKDNIGRLSKSFRDFYYLFFKRIRIHTLTSGAAGRMAKVVLITCGFTAKLITISKGWLLNIFKTETITGRSYTGIDHI